MFNNDKGQGITAKDDLKFWLSAFIVDRRSQGARPGTLSYYQVKFRLFTKFIEKNNIQKVQDITPNDLRNFLIELEQEGHNKGGILAAFRAVKAFLRFYEEELEPENWKNPIYKIKPPRPDDEPLDPVEVGTVKKLLDTCGKNMVGLRDASILTFLLDTGLRAQELLDLNINDIDLLTGQVIVRRGKGGKSRSVFLAKTARKNLRRYLNSRGEDDSKALFVTDERERLTYFGLRSMVRRRSELANLVRPPSLHSFRRSFTINSLRNGADLLTLQILLGHSSLAVIQRYAKQNEEDLIRVHSKTSPVDNML